MTKLLTPGEKAMVQNLGRLAQFFKQDILMPGPCVEDDMREFAFHVHALQNMVLSNAAARAYPEEYRQLGTTVAQTKAVKHATDIRAFQ